MDRTLHEAQEQTRLTNRNGKLEQRAWISVTPTLDLIHFYDGKPIAMPIRTVNIGRTPAKKVMMHVKVQIIKRGSDNDLDFIYEPGHPHQTLEIGIFDPNNPTTDSFIALRRGQPHSVPIILTPEMRKAIDVNSMIVIIHGRVDYLDIFGDSHWLKFCAQTGSIDKYSRKCGDWNDMDKEQ